MTKKKKNNVETQIPSKGKKFIISMNAFTHNDEIVKAGQIFQLSVNDNKDDTYLALAITKVIPNFEDGIEYPSNNFVEAETFIDAKEKGERYED